MKDFYDLHHARSRLVHSIIVIGKEPVFIEDVEDENRKGQWKLYYTPLPGGDRRIIYFPHKTINLTPVPLGFVNVPKHKICCRAYRLPQRGWKIGLDQSNIIFRSVIKGGHIPKLLRSNALKNTIKNIYPSYIEARELVTEPEQSQAFSRNFAIHGSKLIHRFNDTVGEAKEKPELNSDHQFLKEALEKVA